MSSLTNLTVFFLNHRHIGDSALMEEPDTESTNAVDHYECHIIAVSDIITLFVSVWTIFSMHFLVLILCSCIACGLPSSMLLGKECTVSITGTGWWRILGLWAIP